MRVGCESRSGTESWKGAEGAVGGDDNFLAVARQEFLAALIPGRLLHLWPIEALKSGQSRTSQKSYEWSILPKMVLKGPPVGSDSLLCDRISAVAFHRRCS